VSSSSWETCRVDRRIPTMTARDLIGHAQKLLDANLYLTLGTTSADGRPWISPVCFAAAGVREYYWVSAKRCPALTQPHRTPASQPRRLRLHRRAVPRPGRVRDWARPRAVRRRPGRRSRRVPRTQPTRRRCKHLDTRRGHRILEISPLPGNHHRPMGPVSPRTPTPVPAARTRARPPSPHRLTGCRASATVECASAT
jgi:hypothetical protein